MRRIGSSRVGETGQGSRNVRICALFLLSLALAVPASAGLVTIPLSDFLIFSGGGTGVAGASLLHRQRR